MMTNAAFTLGNVLFEIPTGVVADTLGRRVSLLLCLATLFGTTLLYVAIARFIMRSEEHTSELQSRLHLVCRLLLEKKKKSKHIKTHLIKDNLQCPFNRPQLITACCAPQGRTLVHALILRIDPPCFANGLYLDLCAR